MLKKKILKYIYILIQVIKNKLEMMRNSFFSLRIRYASTTMRATRVMEMYRLLCLMHHQRVKFYTT